MVRAGGQSVTLACPAMGTRFEFVLKGTDTVRLRSAGEAAIEEVFRWHNLLSAFDKASVTSRVNRGAVAAPVSVPPEFAELLRWCLAASGATCGAFDIAVGHLMHRAGFRESERYPTSREPLAPGESNLPRFSIDTANRVHFTHFIALDFGAIGKGWAIDRAGEILRDHGVASALIHGGTSSITAIGDDNGRPWRVALGADGPAIDLADESLGLSAPCGREIVDANGVAHGHILDPQTGLSVRTLIAAAVIGPCAAVCDAWSTALMVDPSLAKSALWPVGYRALTNKGRGFQSILSPSPSTHSSLQGCVH